MLGLSQADGLSGPALMTAALLASAAITAITAVTIIGVLQFRSHCVSGRYESWLVAMVYQQLSERTRHFIRLRNTYPAHHIDPVIAVGQAKDQSFDCRVVFG
uniref:Uncharacterized protein n=1 Tax=Gibberella zeae TaxID=5518 RepID=A0A4E9EHF8_GIBZA